MQLLGDSMRRLQIPVPERMRNGRPRKSALACAAGFAALVLMASPAAALPYTVDDDLGSAGFQPFDFVTARWDITFNPETSEAGTLTTLSGSVTDSSSQDWVIFSATVNATDDFILEIGFGVLFKNALGVAHYAGDAGVDAIMGSHGATNIFSFAGLTAGQSTDRLVVAYAAGEFTPPSHSGVNFMVLDGTGVISDSTNISQVPEPASGLLLGLALAGLAAARRRRP